MTSTSDLRRLLDALADETPEVPAQEWLSGTRHKVRARRRRRMAGGFAAAALVLAASVAVAPQVVDDASPGLPPASPPKEDAEFGLAFYWCGSRGVARPGMAPAETCRTFPLAWG